MLLNELMKADYATSMYANYAPTNIEDTLKFINEHSFWMPRHVWFKGTLYDTYLWFASDRAGWKCCWYSILICLVGAEFLPGRESSTSCVDLQIQ